MSDTDLAPDLDLQRRRAEARAAFTATLDEAVAEADRDGTVSLDEIMADFDAFLSETR